MSVFPLSWSNVNFHCNFDWTYRIFFVCLFVCLFIFLLVSSLAHKGHPWSLFFWWKGHGSPSTIPVSLNWGGSTHTVTVRLQCLCILKEYFSPATGFGISLLLFWTFIWKEFWKEFIAVSIHFSVFGQCHCVTGGNWEREVLVAFLYNFKQFQTFVMIIFCFEMCYVKRDCLVFWASKCLLYWMLFELHSFAWTDLFVLVFVIHLNVH